MDVLNPEESLVKRETGSRADSWALAGIAAAVALVHLLTNGHNVKSWLCSLACALAGVCNHRRTVLVFGSGNAPDYIKNSGLLLGVLIRSVIRLGGRLVCRNEHMRQTLITYGAAPEKVAIVPGFLGAGGARSRAARGVDRSADDGRAFHG